LTYRGIATQTQTLHLHRRRQTLASLHRWHRCTARRASLHRCDRCIAATAASSLHRCTLHRGRDAASATRIAASLHRCISASAIAASL
jgi:hypothetical protein